jgi:cytochrome oxidase Cu insertion factor (SCO1/SenC/PrrC family)
MRVKILVAVFLMALFALIGLRHAGFGGIRQQENSVDIQTPQEKRIHAPGFVVNDLAGRQVDLNDYKGSVVLLGFWTTS